MNFRNAMSNKRNFVILKNIKISHEIICKHQCAWKPKIYLRYVEKINVNIVCYLKKTFIYIEYMISWLTANKQTEITNTIQLYWKVFKTRKTFETYFQQFRHMADNVFVFFTATLYIISIVYITLCIPHDIHKFS